MRGYEGLDRPLSRCIHFVRRQMSEVDLRELRSKLQKQGIVCAYVEYSANSEISLADQIASRLSLDNQPYGQRAGTGLPLPWVPFLDDLITLSYRQNGLAIIVDNADNLFRDNQDDAFDLIEAFLIQFHHWFEKRKPCHLCFQIENSPVLQKVFATGC
jgi:hypothetical protein